MDTNEFISAVLGEQETEPVSSEAATQIVVQVNEPPRPFLTTSFEDYTVTEGLLLAVLLSLFVSALVKLIKEGFYWLL